MKCHMEDCDGDMVLTIDNYVAELSNGDKIVTPNIAKEVCNKCGEWTISCREYRKVEANITVKYPDYFTKFRRNLPRLTI